VFKTSEMLLVSYPTSTMVQTEWKFQPRRLEVVKVRDLIKAPLKPDEYLRRPLVHRGRWLVKARDLDRNQVKQFYLASCKEFYRPTGLRLGLYWPGEQEQKPAEVLPGRFACTKRDRILLAIVLARLQKTDFGGFDLRVTVDRRTS
jgi:hypothetical protein